MKIEVKCQCNDAQRDDTRGEEGAKAIPHFSEKHIAKVEIPQHTANNDTSHIPTSHYEEEDINEDASLLASFHI